MAAFKVGKDRAVVSIDLLVSGARMEARVSARKYSRHHRIVDATLKSLGLELKGMPSEEVMLKYKKRLILCTLYYGDDGRVEYAVMASFSPGTLSRLTKRLEEAGWKRLLLLEFKPVKALQSSD
ncbi:MAG: hypothetical protein DRK00_01525 [Thermoprotei archaeon]|nr:MAG: hypothetical protein DRK00_01525 [Thermoprotei archaeon]